MLTRLLPKRHYTSLLPPNLTPNSSNQYKILHFCKLASLPQALHLLNSSSSSEITLKPVVYACLLQTCTKAQSFTTGLQLHSHVIKSGLESDRFVGNSLLSLYFKISPVFEDTQKVFDNLFQKDVISWTSMVSGYLRIGHPDKSLKMFAKMLEIGVEFNAFTLSSVIKACSEIGDLKLGMCFHGVVLVSGFESNNVITSALIDMYGRNLCFGEARKVFDEMSEPDSICCTTVVSALTQNGRFEEALGLFYVMHRKYRLVEDGFTFGSVLTACGNLGRGRQGKEVHGKVITNGICGNVIVESSLVDMYGKCGLVANARRVFKRMGKKNEVSWCALLGAYCQNGDFKGVLKLFREMEREIKGNVYSFGTVLRACAGLTAVRQGKEVHCQHVRKGGGRDVIVESALVDLYAKCGCIDYAKRIFSKVSSKNLITWNSMISGFAHNGYSEEALKMFQKMVDEGICPDYISFVAVLSACSHTGLVDQGKKYFKLMGEVYKIKAGAEHYTCMVDLLGRAGLLKEAEDLISTSVVYDDSSLWAALLGACTAYSDLAIAERAAKKMMELQPDNHLSYVLLANIYNAVGQWGDAQKVRTLMKDRRIKKVPGKSWIDTKNDSSYLDLARDGFLEKGNESVYLAS